MEKREITTNLHGKEGLFEAMALAESCGFPLLLVGEPGVAKTQSMIDYASAIEGDMEKALKSSFVIELDEGTKPSQITGTVDLKKLTQEQEYDVITPITEAKYIMINEVDKGTSGIRNSLLSVMREKALMIGREYRKCNWTTLIGTCNRITTDEEDAPFWDRFLLKLEVPRVSMSKMIEAWTGGEHKVTVTVFTKEEIQQFTPPDQNEYQKCISSFLELYYSHLTDRSAYQIPFLIKACMLVYNEDATEATIRAAKFLNHTKMELIKSLANKIEDPNIQTMKTLIERLGDLTSAEKIRESLKSVRDFLNDPKYSSSKKITIQKMLREAQDRNEVLRAAINQAKKRAEKQSADQENE